MAEVIEIEYWERPDPYTRQREVHLEECREYALTHGLDYSGDEHAWCHRVRAHAVAWYRDQLLAAGVRTTDRGTKGVRYPRSIGCSIPWFVLGTRCGKKPGCPRARVCEIKRVLSAVRVPLGGRKLANSAATHGMPAVRVWVLLGGKYEYEFFAY